VLGLVARRGDRLRQIAPTLGTSCEIYEADVRDQRAVIAAANEFLGKHGTPDVVIGNAGISRGVLTEHAEDASVFRDILETNVLGLVHTFQPFVEPMRKARAGKLVGIASVAGFRGLPGHAAYSASKAGAIRYLEALRVELHGSGVGVVTICPGFIDTPMTKKNPYPMPFIIEADDAARRFIRAIEAGRSEVVIPWRMAILGWILKLLPNTIYDSVLAGRKRKPRTS
jgi:short-subunit dehydrogenase